MLRISVIVCAFNEQDYVAGCLHSLLAQTRPPDEIILVDNASTDATRAVAQAVAGVRIVDAPLRGLTRARQVGLDAASGDVLVYLDADCRAPLQWVERMERRFSRRRDIVAVTGPYRYYDWDLAGRALIRAYDVTLAPATHMLVQYGLRIGAVLYGGNFAVRRTALERIGGFDTSIEFHGEDTNLGRRLAAIGTVEICQGCYLYTSARRFKEMGRGKVCRLYVRNFWSEILHHRPKDRTHTDVRH